MTFPHSVLMYVLSYLYDLAYPLFHGFTGSIEFTAFWMSSLSNRNINNTRSGTLTPSFLALSLKIHSILKFLIRGVLLSKLI